MNLQTLHNQIVQKELDNLYIFLGEEIAVQKIYITKIAQEKCLEIQYVDSYKQIVNELNTQNLFTMKNKLYIILDDIDILKQENIWQEINPGKNTIIFKYNNLDKRNKFYKYFENKIVEFDKLSNEILTMYIQQQTQNTLDDNHCLQLINICNNDYNRILFELDKFNNYKEAMNKDKETINYGNSYFDELEQKGAFHKEISDVIFDFIEQVLLRNIPKIYNLQLQLEQATESNLKVLSLLYTNFKTILLIQSCKSNDICKTTGLEYYQVKYNQNKLNYYSTIELVNILILIQQIEEDIKTGVIDEESSLNYLLVNIL